MCLNSRAFVFLQQADETLDFEEQILEAAKSIAAATSALVKSASAAQRELVAQGKVSQHDCSHKAYQLERNFNIFFLSVPGGLQFSQCRGRWAVVSGSHISCEVLLYYCLVADSQKNLCDDVGSL